MTDTATYYSGLNRDEEHRVNIIGLTGEYSGGIERFDSINAYQLQQLINNNFMIPGDYHNEAPTNEDILAFLEEFPDFRAGGYAVSPARDDYRVSLDTIGLARTPTEAEQQAFIHMCRYADEFECSSEGCFAWFD